MWRYKWISLPHLIFDDECIPGSDGSVGHDKLVKIVNHVLIMHRGPILTFKISSSHLKTCSEIDSWICSLSLNSLTEFQLQISKSSNCHSLLPSLFSFKQLIHLTLVRCIIVPPLAFKGFSCLKSLFFQEVTLSDTTLKCLVSSCPELQRLTLIDIDGPTHIELSNPQLKYLCVSGKFIHICLIDLKLLVDAHFTATTESSPDQPKTCNFSNSLGSLLGIQELYFGRYFLKSLAVSDVTRRLPYTFDHLKKISFPINTEDMKEILVAICLLNSSPNLHELKIWLWHDRESAILPIMDLQEAKDQLKSTFNKLRVVDISDALGTEIELLLIKFVLANSPVLETMKISHAIEDTNKVFTLLKELLQFKRASPQAKIV
ncbi:F-box/FBD/LRR-repeat protein At1g13570-like isoform X3 [Telopea speciosissima]|uniref:F-box/FBD/LRR-repeat protein At1g13570-like isoform X3 n=1 Tax=Telopea speciosissima TaxID=54955 RepID=UPI001CC63436|nr:F-box/FBD/LRR-repeat protein At1g13570-like isoform X3 [Telopea speciosissima]